MDIRLKVVISAAAGGFFVLLVHELLHWLPPALMGIKIRFLFLPGVVLQEWEGPLWLVLLSLLLPYLVLHLPAAYLGPKFERFYRRTRTLGELTFLELGLLSFLLISFVTPCLSVLWGLVFGRDDLTFLASLLGISPILAIAPYLLLSTGLAFLGWGNGNRKGR